MSSVVSKRQVAAWAFWDWGSAAFNAVITTFVFSVYITSDSFGSGASSKLAWAMAAAGLLIALTAPVAGQWADRSGRPTLWLGVNTFALVVLSAALFFVQPDPEFLWLGLGILAVGNIFFELAEVNYNSLLSRVSTPSTVGKISGLGWGMGYIGGIVLLLVVYFGLINPEVGLFGVTDQSGMDVRVSMLLCALWTLVFSLPVIFIVKDPKVTTKAEKSSIKDAYRRLWATVKTLWQEDRKLAFFLIAAAVYRDGLAGVFTFGAVIAATVFDFSPGDVIIFGVVANLISGVATIISGALDDKVGPRAIITVSLIGMVVSGLGVFVFSDAGPMAFWVCGLCLVIFVGPAQNSSRTFLARTIPPGKEGEVFGLYATTGRAVSFMSPAAFALSVSLGSAVTGSSLDDAQHWGILGIVLVLTVGLGLLLKFVKPVPASAPLIASKH